MIGVWAVIQNGIILNTVMVSQTDYKDPQYAWVEITNYDPRPSIGWTTTDFINFTPPVED